MSSEEFAEFVSLKGFEDDYEIQTTYPFTIKKKSNQRIIAEGDYRQNGYVCVNLNGKLYYKHILIAKQFLKNPDNLPQIDHISRDRSDYHLSNLRYVSSSDNSKNKRCSTANTNIIYEYVDDIPDEVTVVNSYDTKANHYVFENYYFHDNVFYYFTGIQYRKLHINTEKKSGSLYVNMNDINNKQVQVHYSKFKRLYNLI